MKRKCRTMVLMLCIEMCLSSIQPHKNDGDFKNSNCICIHRSAECGMLGPCM